MVAKVDHGPFLLGVLDVVSAIAKDAPGKVKAVGGGPHDVDDVSPPVIIGTIVVLEVISKEVADDRVECVVLFVREAGVDDIGDALDVGMVDVIDLGKEGHQCPAVRWAVWLAGPSPCSGVAAGLRLRCSCLCPRARSRNILRCLQGEDGFWKRKRVDGESRVLTLMPMVRLAAASCLLFRL